MKPVHESIALVLGVVAVAEERVARAARRVGSFGGIWLFNSVEMAVAAEEDRSP
jgi:hypothetical protein